MTSRKGTAPRGEVLSEPTAVGEALARIAGALSELEARDLLRILRSALAGPFGPTVQVAMLGLLAEMLDSNAEVPAGEEYETLRAKRAAQGEEWPDRTALGRQYGGWIAAVHAAMRLWSLGQMRGSGSAGGRPPERKYSREEAVTAVLRFRERFGAWPRVHEYLTWASLERRLALRIGQPAPRLPSSAPLKRLWPGEGFSGALAEAQRRYETGGGGAR